ncbi:pre-mRNA-processing factor 39 isoform X1 [Epinephelus fuscoguttatus]|uniref:pre-mRNA-processing factor 39 isoform X1 n=1 Tax=Epinephelus fuscoguttatus TaxID=293821 RepID=UPI0020D16C08|nr:pre-mRNA-processing factor 39 isoform X1 [Epinephelus fuscoguttatus]
MEDTGLHLSDNTITGMLDTESPAMESNGDAFLPDLPVLGQTADWSPDQATSEPLTSILPEDSDASQDAPGQQEQEEELNNQMNSTELGSVEKAVEQFQIASAQLFQQEQPPPPPPQPEEEAEQPEEHKTDYDSQEMSVEPEPAATMQDGSQDGTEAPQVAEDGMELEEPPKDATEEATPPPEPPSEFEKLYKACEENPEDFNGWVYLLQYVEQENELSAVRKSFDVFFLRYPYCYGYWKKYADIEKKHENVQVAEEVYRRGLQAIPLSVDLWLHYLTYIKENSDPSDPETEGRIRAAYEHAVAAAGTDFRSDRLWEAFVNWETEQGKLGNVTAIYDRILGIPTQLYSQHFQRFKDHVQSNHPRHFLSEEEFVQLRLELSKASLTSMIGEDEETPVPQEELPPGTEDLADPAKRVTEIENMRHKVIEVRQEVFNHNEHEVSKRWTFEEGIKRPYFHVKALEKTQLNNWKEYLDFEIENGTPERVVVLFERCLIACALYEEFWMKYAKYLEGYSTDGVRHVYKKACTIHLPKKPAIHLLWAAFEEQQGNVEEARGILKSLEESVPGLAMVRLRRVSLERRHGNLEEAEALLREAMESAKNATETSFYAVKLARQMMKVQRSLSKARKVLLDAIEKDQTSPKLYLNLLELEYSGDVAQNEAEILACFDRALKSQMPLESRLLFCQRKVEFLEDFGSDINVLVAAYEEQQKLQKENEPSKRKAENGYDSSQEPDAKRQRVDDGSTVAAGAATDTTANNSAYNYNWYQQQYGGWGQNSWGQYNQYAGYNQYYPPPPT